MTNWYSIFYWLTVSDTIKSVTNGLLIFFAIVGVISLIGYFYSTTELSSKKSYSNNTDGWEVWVRAYKRAFTLFSIMFFITTLLYLFIPSKRDALIIIAGGTVGNFVTRDTSAKAIPSEVMMLLRTKIKEEINETTIKEALSGETDTFKNKTREQLEEIIKNKK